MFDFGSMLAITTMFAVRDYYNDKERLKREMANQYRICFNEIGDNVADMGQLIIKTVEKSGCKDLEQQIVQGAQQLPLYILLEVVKVQGRPLTANQLKIVDISFNRFKYLGFTKLEYMMALSNNDQTRKLLEDSVGLTTEHCGEFWRKFIGLIYKTEMSDADFAKLVCCYSEIVFRMALLGDCKVERAEWIYNRFSDGLMKHMKVYNEEEFEIDHGVLTDLYGLMKDNCRELDQAVNEDGILVDLLDYFVVALIIGYLEDVDLNHDLKISILEYLMDELSLAVDATAAEIYSNYEFDAGMKQVFYDSANSWEDANFWKIQLISAIRAEREDDAIDFAESTIAFMQMMEFVIIDVFGVEEGFGWAARYMTNAVNELQAMGVDGIKF